jgi:hypothetical protein
LKNSSLFNLTEARIALGSEIRQPMKQTKYFLYLVGTQKGNKQINKQKETNNISFAFGKNA